MVGCGLADGLHQQLFHLAAKAVALDPGYSSIHHIADTRHRQRGFCHVGRQHDAAVTVGLEYTILFLERQPREQRQNLRTAGMMLAQGLGGFADFTFAGKEHQDVAAGSVAGEIVYGIQYRGLDVLILLQRFLPSPSGTGGDGGFCLQRPIPNLHRKHPP